MTSTTETSFQRSPVHAPSRVGALRQVYDQELRASPRNARRLWQILVLLTGAEEDRLAYDDAYVFGQKTIKLGEQLKLSPHIETARVLAILARIELLRSRNKQALTLLFRAQAIADALDEPAPELAARIHLHTGQAHSYSSQYEPAKLHLDAAMAIAREHFDPMGATESSARISLASIHMALKQPGQTIRILDPLFEHLLTVFPKHEHQFRYVVSELADANRMLGYHDHAVSLYRRAIALTEKLLGPDDASLSMLQHELGLCLLRSMKASDALAVLTPALPKLARHRGKRSAVYIHALSNYADALLCAGRRREALAASAEARALARRCLPRKSEIRTYARTVNQIAWRGARLSGLLATIKAAASYF